MIAMDVDQTILARRAKIVGALQKIVRGEGVIAQEPAGAPMKATA